ncbi:hypothetical protein A3J90_00595 [candidate division WOR-1 bacterium RIFOXYC2_FULL_37_10]|uniref:Uncharacterized protein n=1 Tax=candidate division WOR-1 bacterium RIFOXYB2_FULL_37_13 TaxID=1802579 RepID=A0A1F4SKM7_UNCSA|nr:MAG: hypothetical protein A2246_02365 [candidate division WOR-1 bacterium RIFOXYA2_FULL_37_7]OGC21014.1 MAG: hypothetical protein A2310_00650 [candidate division WOR-1 bacterium RIFOXYB2_FULL_37_13]OGC36684.1 MAG: hypothetical protein A3J90_00595 [candidate division WOR-1 bacterium RIFOXYC2_FULL_37_10]
MQLESAREIPVNSSKPTTPRPERDIVTLTPEQKAEAEAKAAEGAKGYASLPGTTKNHGRIHVSLETTKTDSESQLWMCTTTIKGEEVEAHCSSLTPNFDVQIEGKSFEIILEEGLENLDLYKNPYISPKTLRYEFEATQQ